MSVEHVRGYFTIERNIVGLTLREMELALGFRPGRLAPGARVLVLQRQPLVGEFVYAASTLRSDAKGLVGVDQRLAAASTTIPHAWLGQRLVKIHPSLPHSDAEVYPSAQTPVEQWQLLRPVPAEEVARLSGSQAYWPPRA
jgi:hypothetical protein